MNGRRSTAWGAAVALAVLAVLAEAAAAGDWPHWRGPRRDGTTDERSGWSDKAWPGEAVWTASVGAGASSPLVVGGSVFALGWDDGWDRVTSLDAKTGRPRWSVRYRAPAFGRNSVGDKGFYSGPSATPELDPATGYLYTLGVDGDLCAWDTARNGEQVWRRNLYDDFSVAQRPKVGRSSRRDYGYTTAPLVHGDWLIVEAGAATGNLVAFDKRTGRQAWTSANTDPAGHTGGPLLLDVAGVPCVAVLTLEHLLVVRLDGQRAGETVVEVPWATHFANNVPSPTAAGDEILLTSAYNRNAIRKLRIRLDGAETVWERDLASKVCSPVVFRGHVCWAWQRLHCLDFATGKTLWEGGDFGDAGSLVATGDGRLIVWTDPGLLVLADGPGRSPDAYLELARRADIVEAAAWPHVALAEGGCSSRTASARCGASRPEPSPAPPSNRAVFTLHGDHTISGIHWDDELPNDLEWPNEPSDPFGGLRTNYFQLGRDPWWNQDGVPLIDNVTCPQETECSAGAGCSGTDECHQVDLVAEAARRDDGTLFNCSGQGNAFVDRCFCSGPICALNDNHLACR